MSGSKKYIENKDSSFQEKECGQPLTPLSSSVQCKESSCLDIINQYQSPIVEVTLKNKHFDHSLIDAKEADFSFIPTSLKSKVKDNDSFCTQPSISNDNRKEDSFWNISVAEIDKSVQALNTGNTDIHHNSSFILPKDSHVKNTSKSKLSNNSSINKTFLSNESERASTYLKEIDYESLSLGHVENENVTASIASGVNDPDLSFRSDGTFTVEVLEAQNSESLIHDNNGNFHSHLFYFK